MKRMSMPNESTEYLRCKVIAQTDPTAGTVHFSTAAVGSEPVSWTAGAWNGSATVRTDGSYEAEARILCGAAGDITPTAGSWSAWVRVTLGSEAVIRQFALLTVT